jgi:hypothetical protein
MPNWLKQTLHVVAIAAGVVATLPTMGLALPIWPVPVLTAAGIAGLAAAKAAPGAKDGKQ